MGLDITAYSYLRPAQSVEIDDYGEPKDWRRYWRPGPSIEWTEKEWPGRTEGVDPSAIYETYGAFNFRAGSYSGYNVWRNWLATIVGFTSAEDCWKRGKFGDPFFELVHFADNEGVIGPVVSRKLAADFAANMIAAIDKKPAEHGDWYISQYVRWWAACMTAAEGGAIDFH